MSWQRRTKDGVVMESRISVGSSPSFEICIHRHRDEEPDQWFVTCHRYGIERVPIGQRRSEIDVAEKFAIKAIKERLRVALRALDEAP